MCATQNTEFPKSAYARVLKENIEELSILIENIDEYIDNGLDLRPATYPVDAIEYAKLQGWLDIKNDLLMTFFRIYNMINGLFLDLNYYEIEGFVKLMDADEGGYPKSLSIIKHKIKHLIRIMNKELNRLNADAGQKDVKTYSKKQKKATREIMTLPQFFQTDDAYKACGVSEKKVSKATIDSTLRLLCEDGKIKKRKHGQYTNLIKN